MFTYAQLLKSKGAVRKQLWLICGKEAALIQDAIELAKDHVYSGVSTVCLGIFFGQSKSQDELLDFLSMPHFEERKLAIIHESEHLEINDRLLQSIDNIDSSTFIVFIHNGIPNEDDLKVKLLTNNKVGRAVRCNALKPDDVKMWVNSRLNISSTALNSLLSKFYGDYEWLLNKIRILERLNMEEISPLVVERVCFDIGIQDFGKSLIEFDKEQCFLYIRDRELNDINLSEIINDVHNLSLLQSVIGQYSQQLRPLSDKTGLTRQQLDKYMDKVSYYDLPASQKCLGAITTLYKGLAANDRASYLSLVCRW
jgi:hypothetical protein